MLRRIYDGILKHGRRMDLRSDTGEMGVEVFGLLGNACWGSASDRFATVLHKPFIFWSESRVALTDTTQRFDKKKVHLRSDAEGHIDVRMDGSRYWQTMYVYVTEVAQKPGVFVL